MSRTVGVIVGSVREKSLNRRVGEAIKAEAPDSLKFVDIPINHLSYYNADLETDNPPADWVEIRDAFKACDAILFLAPEYNRSIPGVLKNAIDVMSRPPGKPAIGGKPSAIVSASPGGIGGFGANQHLRQILSCLNTPQLPGPEMYLGNVKDDWFDAQGRAANEGTRKYLAKFGQTFADWIETNAT